MNRKFIVIEGNDFTGKSTLAKALVKRLEQKGSPFLHVREPGGTVVGETLRGLMIDTEVQTEHTTDVLLAMTSRHENVVKNILPALAEDKIVICERFMYSTWAYNVFPYLEEKPELADIFAGMIPYVLTESLPEPLLVLLTCPLSVRKERSAGRTLDRIEQRSDAELVKTEEAYDSFTSAPNCKVIDSTLPIDTQVDMLMVYLEALATVEVPVEEATETEVTEIEPEVEVEPEVKVPFVLEDAIQEYVDTHVFADLFEGDESVVADYQERAKKVIRVIYKRLGEDPTLFSDPSQLR